MPNQVWEEDCEAVQGASPAKVWIGIFLRREQLWCPTPTKGAGLLSFNIQRYTSSAFLKQCFPFPARKHSNFGASLLVGVCSVADSQKTSPRKVLPRLVFPNAENILLPDITLKI